MRRRLHQLATRRNITRTSLRIHTFKYKADSLGGRTIEFALRPTLRPWLRCAPSHRRFLLIRDSATSLLLPEIRIYQDGKIVSLHALVLVIYVYGQRLKLISQSKLSQEQLSELQRSTHFDKKELQQWYKGVDKPLLPSSSG